MTYAVNDNAERCELHREVVDGFHTQPLGLQCRVLRKVMCVTNLTWMLALLGMLITARRH